MYDIITVPIVLYWDSDSALARNPNRSGVLNETGSYQIINERTVDGVRVIGIGRNNVAIGWVRHDDNFSSSTGYFNSSYNQVDLNSYFNFSQVGDGIQHKVIIRINGKNLKTYGLTSARQIIVNFTLSERSTIYKETPNSVDANLQFVLETYYNGQFVPPSRTYTQSFRIPESVAPRFTTNVKVSIQDGVSGVAYANKSTVTITSGAYAVGEGARLAKQEITIDGITTTGGALEYKPRSAGEKTFTVTVTDSRGRQAKQTGNINVEVQKPPSITLFQANRIPERPQQVNIIIQGDYDLTNTQPPTVTWHRRQVGTVAWSRMGSRSAMPFGSGRYSFITGYGGFDATRSYEIRAVITDSQGLSTQSTITVGTEEVPISLGSFGAGVGVMFDESAQAALQVGDKGIYSKGDIVVDGVSLQKSFKVDALKAGDDLNQVTQSGMYRLQDGHKNAPPWTSWANMLVMNGGQQLGSDTLAQVIISISDTPEMFFRSATGHGRTWKPWQKVTTTRA